MRTVVGAVEVARYDGPLGLLLELIDQGQVEVSTVSVGYITNRYLARIAQLDITTPEELADFADLGSRLLYIKSLSLLPDSDPEDQPEELGNLNRELAEYRRMQSAATALKNLATTRTWAKTTTFQLDPKDLPYPNIELQLLQSAFAKAMANLKPSVKPTVIKRHITQAQLMSRIKQTLAQGSFELAQFLGECSTRLEVIVAILAVLELWRNGTVRVIQDSQFAPITVEAQGA